MSRALPPFFAELGIEDADSALDERTLRRAYARRLKLIDIEGEPLRFQDLREALEAALRWSAARDRDAESAPAAVDANEASHDAEPTPPAAPALAADAPEALADAVFATFQPQVATFLDRALAHDAVQHALADPRLVSIDARTFFEWRIARLLAEGWQAGHQHLLSPAIEAFGWDGDHARLANLGQVGALLAAAVRDIEVTQGFTEAQKVAIAPLLDRIRAAVPPDADTLADDIAALQFLVQRVPNWLRLVSPVEPVNQRFQMWRDRPAAPPATAAPPVGAQPRSTQKTPSSQPGMVAVVVAIILTVLSQIGRLTDHSSGGATRPQVVVPVAAETRALEERQQRADALLEAIRHPALPRKPASPAAPFMAPDPFKRVPSTLDQPWYAPDWAKDPGARGSTTPPD